MSLILVRQKARQLRSRKRRQVFGSVVAPIVVAFFYGFCIKQFPHIHPLLHALFMFALAWSVVGIYLLNRAMSSGEMPGDAGFSTGLEFCRREMERHTGGQDISRSKGDSLHHSCCRVDSRLPSH